MSERPPEKPDTTPDTPDTTTGEQIKPAMSEQEIRDAGLAVDVPFESGSANPERLTYGDLGPEKKYAAKEAKDKPPADQEEEPPDGKEREVRKP